MFAMIAYIIITKNINKLVKNTKLYYEMYLIEKLFLSGIGRIYATSAWGKTRYIFL